jgi:DNA (cytosine-5)-methyltransferase 1
MQMSTKLKVLDLFSGIGGFTLGLHKTNLYETVAFCEWDKNCQQVLVKHWPDTPCYSDIKNLSSQDLPEIDVITGGFPCQDISYAGKGAGIEGERSGHWKHYWRLIDETKPKGVIIENVSALRSRGLDVVLSDLNEIGYDAEWHCLTAKHFGAYHERDRLFILAYSRSNGGQGFKPMECSEKVGQGWESSKENLQQVYDTPFRRSDSFPKPLLRGMDVRLTRRVDRLKQVGNSIYWPIVEKLGYHLHKNVSL